MVCTLGRIAVRGIEGARWNRLLEHSDHPVVSKSTWDSLRAKHDANTRETQSSRKSHFVTEAIANEYIRTVHLTLHLGGDIFRFWKNNSSAPREPRVVPCSREEDTNIGS